MTCCIEELQNKDVINIENGCKIGYVIDVEADVVSGNISAIIVCPTERVLSFKKPESFRINWCDIVVIGEETILVKNVVSIQSKSKGSGGIFNIFSK